MALTPRNAKSVPVRQFACSRHLVLSRHIALQISILFAASAPSHLPNANTHASHPNHFDMGDGRFIRDSQAERGNRNVARRGRKRKVERQLPESVTERSERLLKLPKLAGLKQRVLEKAAARAEAA